MKKVVSVLIALAIIVTFIQAFVYADGKPIGTIVEGNVQFHCGFGNGGPNRDKFVGYNGELLELKKVTEDRWELQSKDYVCKCGRNDWMSYSNMDGEYDGKNIQLCHIKKEETEPNKLVFEIEANLEVTKQTRISTYQKTITPYEEHTQYVSPVYSSVTATTAAQIGGIVWDKNGSPTKNNNDGIIVKNSNHFTYAKIDASQLEAGVNLDLVVGNKIDKIGTMTVKSVGEKLQINTDGFLDGYKFGAVAFTKILEPKNGNIHSEKIFKHDNKATIDLPDEDKNGFIYLYIHFESVQLKKGNKTDSWTVEVESKIGERIDTETEKPISLPVGIELYDCDDINCDDENCELIESDAWENMVPGAYKYVATVYSTYDLEDTVIKGKVYIFADQKLTEVIMTKNYSITLVPVDGPDEWADQILNDTIIINKIVIVK